MICRTGIGTWLLVFALCGYGHSATADEKTDVLDRLKDAPKAVIEYVRGVEALEKHHKEAEQILKDVEGSSADKAPNALYQAFAFHQMQAKVWEGISPDDLHALDDEAKKILITSRAKHDRLADDLHHYLTHLENVVRSSNLSTGNLFDKQVRPVISQKREYDMTPSESSMGSQYIIIGETSCAPPCRGRTRHIPSADRSRACESCGSCSECVSGCDQ